MENQEQNSKLENTDLKITVEPLATQYRAILKPGKEVLQKEFDTFWEGEKEFLVKELNYKGKKKKGGKIDYDKARKAIEQTYGISKLYQTPAAKYAEIYLNDHYENLNESIMFMVDLKIDNWDTDDPSIIAFFYFWPKINFHGELNFDIQSGNWGEESKKQALEGRLKDLQYQHKTYEEPEDDSITEDMEVEVDIIASINGNPYDEGTVRKQWTPVKYLESAVLKEDILEHTKGDLFEVSFPNTLVELKEGEEPETVTAQVKIHNTRLPKFLDIDSEELYKVAGFESKEKFEEKFEQEYENYVDNAKRSIVFDHVMNQIVMGSKLDPIPQSWITSNAMHLKQQHMQYFKNDMSKCLTMLGVESEKDYEKALEGQIFKDTINRMAVQYYQNLFNISSDDMDEVIQHILSKVNWIDSE